MMIGEMIYMSHSTIYALFNESNRKGLKVVRVEDKSCLKRKIEPYRSITASEYLKEKCKTNKLFSCFA